MEQLQAIDWYDLRENIVEIDEHHVVFRFNRANEPKLTQPVLDNLMANFKELVVTCEPIVGPSIDGITYTMRPGNTVVMELKFKSKEQQNETERLIYEPFTSRLTPKNT